MADQIFDRGFVEIETHSISPTHMYMTTHRIFSMQSKTLNLQKSFKIPKGLLESVNRRGTDNTMAKGKSTKKTVNRKQMRNAMKNIKYHTARTVSKFNIKIVGRGDELRYFGMACSSCVTSDSRRVAVKRNAYHLIWKS
jgi:hypothetical protein